jgi:hypothetical protein
MAETLGGSTDGVQSSRSWRQLEPRAYIKKYQNKKEDVAIATSTDEAKSINELAVLLGISPAPFQKCCMMQHFYCFSF